MSDSGQKDIALKAGIEGADDIAAAAPKALNPWESGAKKVGTALKGAFVGAMQDAARLVTVSNAISLDRALDSARKYRQELGLLSTTAGPVGKLRAELGYLSKTRLVPETELLSADRSLGRMTYSTKNALLAMGALSDQAQATGETLKDKLPLGAALMSGMGVSSAMVGDELDRVRSLADALGTSGGLLAAEDRLTAMSGLLSEIGTKTDSDRAKLEALALGIGKGLGPEAGKRVSANVLGTLSSHRETFAALAGMKVSALSDEQGNLRVDKGLDALAKFQSWARRQSKDRGMQQMIAASLFGGDRQAGAAVLDADIAKMRRAAETVRPTGKTASEAAAYRASEAGQAERRNQDAERNAREAAEKLLVVADKLQGPMSSHPILGGLAANMGINLGGQALGAGLGKLGGMLFGKKGQAIAEGVGGLAGAAGAGGERVFVTNWPSGFGGGGGLGDGALSAGKGLLTAGGAKGLLGSGAAAAAVPAAVMGTIAAFTVKSLADLGEGSKVKQGFDVVNISPEKAAENAAKAKAAESGAAGERSSGMRSALIAEAERVVKQRGIQDPLEAFREAKKLGASPEEAEAVAKRIQVTVVVENHSESVLTVNGQQQAGGLTN